ncbi:tail tape measure protein [Sphingomonas sp. Tas61C01]|uniref:tail tape measure protein n=1 Tax=Sphingomonas sp. Tas61C01 TaxID=3458297 RepID=UPI00403E5F70
MSVFTGEVVDMRRMLERELGAGGAMAAQLIETALVGVVRKGKLSFEDLKATALSVLAQIAAAAVKVGLDSLGKNGGGQKEIDWAAAFAELAGSPGRATGGPVSPGRAYVVGERGPELFVPTTSGRVETGAPGGVREVRVSITINAGAEVAPKALAQSSRQVARVVRAALEG